MDAVSEATTSSRKAYWLSMAALIVVLPAALVAHTWQDATTWLSQHRKESVPAKMNTPIDYAGARWTVTRFVRLPGSGQGSAAVLAEFEATAADPKALGAIPCEVRLSDDKGRIWHPTLFADPAIGAAFPDAARRGLCGGVSFAEAQPGKPAMMAASFSVPAKATGLRLSIAMSSAQPDYLDVAEPAK